MKRPHSLVPVLVFRRILFEILEHQPNVCIRFRLLGEMWKTNFFRITQVTEKGGVFNDEINNKIVLVNDLNNIMQFEIDARFKEFQPLFHYDLEPEKINS